MVGVPSELLGAPRIPWRRGYREPLVGPGSG